MKMKLITSVLATAAMACLLLTATTSRAATLPVSEDFSDSTLHTELEEETSGVWDFSTGEAFPSDTSSGGNDSRDYIRTVDTDYNTVDFTAEVTMNLVDDFTEDNAMFGLGDGVPGPRYDEPTLAVYVQLAGNKDEVAVKINDGDEEDSTGTNQGGEMLLDADGVGAVAGTHRARMSKLGNDLTFSVDLDWAGSGFTSDVTHTVDLTATGSNGFEHLDTTTSRLFMGTGNDGGAQTTFDDFTVVPEPGSALLLLLGGSLAALLRGRLRRQA